MVTHGLFGGHVARRTHNHSGLGHMLGGVVDIFGQAEIAQLYLNPTQADKPVGVGFGRRRYQQHIARF